MVSCKLQQPSRWKIHRCFYWKVSFAVFRSSSRISDLCSTKVCLVLQGPSWRQLLCIAKRETDLLEACGTGLCQALRSLEKTEQSQDIRTELAWMRLWGFFFSQNCHRKRDAFQIYSRPCTCDHNGVVDKTGHGEPDATKRSAPNSRNPNH